MQNFCCHGSEKEKLTVLSKTTGQIWKWFGTNGHWLILYPWVKVFRIIPEIRILRLTFYGKSASKCWIGRIIIGFLVYIQSVWKQFGNCAWNCEYLVGMLQVFKIWVSKFRILEILNLHPCLLRLGRSKWSVEKHGHQGGGGKFCRCIYRGKNKKSSCQKKTTKPIWKWFGINGPRVTLCQDCLNYIDPLKNIAARGQGQFYLCMYIEFYKKSSCKKTNPWFKNNLAQMVIGDPLPSF